MPIKINRAYTRALEKLGKTSKSRLDNILDADPRMAEFLNEHGMLAAAQSPYPVAVIPPEEYLKMARKHDPLARDYDNRNYLVDRIKKQQPSAREMDFYSSETTPGFLQDYMRENPDAYSYEIYTDNGVGLPKGYDTRHGVDNTSHVDDGPIDLRGIPMLGYAPRGEDAISILSHEGRGRQAFAYDNGASLPSHMIQHTAILPGDYYVPYENSPGILRRMGFDEDTQLRADGNLHHQEPVELGGEYPMERREAMEFFRRIGSVVPEDYIRNGVGNDGMTLDPGDPLPTVPWKFPTFAEGGSVEGDDTGALRRIAEFYRSPTVKTAQRFLPGGEIVNQFAPRLLEGIASEYYGVNDKGNVNLGGYSKGAPLRDRFRPNVAVEMLGLPALWGHEPSLAAAEDSMRTDTAVRDAFGLGDERNFADSAAYFTGKTAAIPILSAGRGLNTLTQSLLKNAGKAVRYPVRAAELATDFFNPASGRVRDTPVAGVIGAGIQEGLGAFLEDPEAELSAAIHERYGDPEAFMQALQQGDEDAQRFAQEYDRIKQLMRGKEERTAALTQASLMSRDP